MKIKGFFSYIFGNFLSRLSTFQRTLLQMHYLSDSENADIFSLSNKIMTVFRRPLVGGNFQSIFSYYHEKHKLLNKEKEFCFFVLCYISAFFCILSIAVLSAFRFFVWGFNISNTQLFFKNILCFLPLIPGMFLLYLFKSMCDLRGKVSFSASTSLLGNVAYILCVLVFARFGSYFNGFVFGSLTYCFSQVLFLFWAVKEYLVIDYKFYDREFLVDFLKIQYESLIPFSEIITSSLASSFGTGVVSHIEYAHKCLQFLFAFIGDSLTSSIVPILSKSVEKQDGKNIFIVSHIISTVFSFLLMFYGGQITMIVLKKTTISDFKSFAKIMNIFSLSFYFYIMNRVISSILISRNRLNKSILAQIANSILNVVLSFWLIKHRQYGIVWASNISLIFQFVLSLYNLFVSQDNFLDLRDKINFFLIIILSLILVKWKYFSVPPLFAAIILYNLWKTYKEKWSTTLILNVVLVIGYFIESDASFLLASITAYFLIFWEYLSLFF